MQAPARRLIFADGYYISEVLAVMDYIHLSFGTITRQHNPI
jgi:hypothetical protein